MLFDVSIFKELNQLDMDQVSSWPPKVKIVITTIVIILSAGLGWHLFISPKLQILDLAVQAEERLKGQFQAKYRVSVNLPAHETQLKKMEQYFTSILKSLPTSNETPGLLDDITSIGTSAGLSFKLLQWQPEIKKGFYLELPIKIEVVGKYHDFGQFVTKIARLPRIVTLHDFILSNETEGLVLQMQAKTYRTLNKAEATTI